MSERPRRKTTAATPDKDWLLVVPADLEMQVADAAKKLPHLKKPVVARMALERGLSVLLKQLTETPA